MWHHCHLEFRQIYKIFFGFVMNLPVADVAKQCKVSSATAVQWYVYIREALSTAAWHAYEKIGKLMCSSLLYRYTT